jgi:DNA-binding XRE family transcriptional regulator
MAEPRSMFGEMMFEDRGPDKDPPTEPRGAPPGSPAQLDAALVRETRRCSGLSAPEFAARLRVSVRTLDNWEQGRARPNAQAAVLIMLVRVCPETLERLADLGR